LAADAAYQAAEQLWHMSVAAAPDCVRPISGETGRLSVPALQCAAPGMRTLTMWLATLLPLLLRLPLTPPVSSMTIHQIRCSRNIVHVEVRAFESSAEFDYHPRRTSSHCRRPHRLRVSTWSPRQAGSPLQTAVLPTFCGASVLPRSIVVSCFRVV
jgi:hypothetical protein